MDRSVNVALFLAAVIPSAVLIGLGFNRCCRSLRHGAGVCGFAWILLMELLNSRFRSVAKHVFIGFPGPVLFSWLTFPLDQIFYVPLVFQRVFDYIYLIVFKLNRSRFI
ncbi:hypothetical protein F5B18DRAFT_645590 [Nemania serpens]|nr:hypothetical protein F5B18DRAFT_645590 [Nemania serpens]